jgi:hypothetical protein
VTGVRGASARDARDDSQVPTSIQKIMGQSRSRDATWSLLVTDVDSGKSSNAVLRDLLYPHPTR